MSQHTQKYNFMTGQMEYVDSSGNFLGVNPPLPSLGSAESLVNSLTRLNNTSLPNNNASSVTVTPTTGATVNTNLANPSAPVPAGYAGFDQNGSPIAVQNWADMTGLQKLSTGVSMAASLASIWSGIQQNRLARDNFNLQKGVMDTNLANQISSYNTALEDRVAGRYSQREAAANQSEINDYLDRNRAVNRMA